MTTIGCYKQLAGHSPTAMRDLHLLIPRQLDQLLLELCPGHAVAVALHLNAGVRVDQPHPVQLLRVRRLLGQRQHASDFLPLEAHHQLFAGRSVQANNGYLATPATQVEQLIDVSSYGRRSELGHDPIPTCISAGCRAKTKPAHRLTRLTQAINLINNCTLTMVR
jgi:hypothetical protein